MTGFNGLTGFRFPFDTADDKQMLGLWLRGHDTLDIACIMRRPESEIANHLPHVLLASRQDAAWDQTATA